MGIVARWKLRWETWDLRLVILISLSLQILLIFLAPLRKRVSKAWITMPIWSAYLLADVTATFAVGLISNSQGDTYGPFTDPTLLAFWAPFLLVHLGGPDTITAFALEDNELWLRHFLGLGFQCWAVGYAFVQSFPNHKLWIPTLLIFLAGFIKYIERTRALYLASSRIIKESFLTDPDPGPNYAKFMDEYASKKDAKLPTEIEMIPEPPSSMSNITGNNEDKEDLSNDQKKKMSCLEVVQTAHKYYTTFKGLIADLIFSISQRNESRDYFLKRTAIDAFHIIEVELNFFYDIHYTKARMMQAKFLGYPLGYPLRIISFSLTCAALVLFYLIEKKKFYKFDIVVSYTLLIGAIALDLIAFLMILWSDWTAVALTKSEHPNWFIKILPKWFIKILQCLLKVDRVRWLKTPRQKPKWFYPKNIMHIVHLRWSKSLSRYNLINYCLHPRMKWWEKTIAVFGLTNMLDGVKYVRTEHFSTELRDFIFEELKMKSKQADDMETAKEIFSARGDWILRYESRANLLCWINDVEFDESLILWHIATELCYYDPEDVKGKNDPNHPEDVKGKNDPNRKFSKHLSDYLLYLLVMQSTMLSNIAGIGQIRFRDTCAEAKKFFRGRNVLEEEKDTCQKIVTFCKYLFCCFNKCCFKGKKDGDESPKKKACRSILNVNTEVEPIAVKGDRSKSVLFDACRLAKELQKIERPLERWKIISKVWVELMCYAAGQCRADAHMAQLSKGGQLLTFIWLLMVQLGLANKLEENWGKNQLPKSTESASIVAASKPPSPPSSTTPVATPQQPLSPSSSPSCSCSPSPPPSQYGLRPCSVSPSLTRSSEKPITKSTHLHLSVVEGVTGGREIIVDAVAAEIADDTEEVDDGEIDELYVGMKKSAAAATKGLGNHNRSPLGHTP
ncbi:hypothetical protein RHGRI_006378 [Rhododendron griersonianum]|uniref:DUF4220 domain-containing protein n=1 Tax=Rhododendron griersonianum TaxID=479676 RepID=A0AAV6KSU1_9ERIC|nr:hypothetical protein RHGRI_006378 [Rhododendron griersonianum]